EIFAASILGGLTSIYGAVLGGLIIGGSEIIITSLGSLALGSWVAIYQKAIPLVLMVITLLVMPRGIVSIDFRRLLRLRRRTWMPISVPIFGNPVLFLIGLGNFVALYVAISLSLNLEAGYTGIPNFGKVLFVAGGASVGGAVSGRLATY